MLLHCSCTISYSSIVLVLLVTAEHIYDECDGLEYENSASTIDLRFVPSDTEFEDEPHSIATENSVAADFEPSTLAKLSIIVAFLRY